MRAAVLAAVLALAASPAIAQEAGDDWDLTVDETQDMLLATVGYSCIAEVRTVETILRGKAETPFLKHGDTVRIEMLDDHHHSIFGAIEQTVGPA